MSDETETGGVRVSLAQYDNAGFQRGRSRIVELLWLIAQALFVSSSMPGIAHRRFVLRLFGAMIGRGVIVKPGVRVKFPWRLRIADHSWVGEAAWIDNLAGVEIGSNCCISQGVYICTGSHDWTSPKFALIVKPITIEDGAWIAAKAMIGPGVRVGRGAVLTLGSVASHDLEPWTIYRGAPAVAFGVRTIIDSR